MAYGTIKVDTIENTNGQTGNAIGPGFKNRIINGDMRIDQRNAGAAVTGADYTVDRWYSINQNDGARSVQQSSTAPTGFVNSVVITTTTADTSLSASQFSQFRQPIEGTNVSDLAWGSASAKTVTLSFWVRSSLTGTFAGGLRNSAADRSYVFTYSISSANTWEYKTITIAGDTSGTWLTTTGIGINVIFDIGTGSNFQTTAGSWAAGSYWSTSGATAVIGTLNATWYITGVQLEVGPSATSFDYRPYGTELALCQRYFYKTSGSDVYSVLSAAGSASNTTNVVASVPTKVTMRSAPSFSSTGNLCVSSNSLNNLIAVTSIGTGSRNTAEIPLVSADVASGLTASGLYVIYANNSSTAALLLSSEL